ncbi:molybdopterin-dependent oxidoreductase [Salipaludibacillus sp. CUR1]|uniref:molybdopterin-dependent oxidoreductase n=1 Tax=Salipaludibacillus sp. CUR1 TaxID=2820003 RepID=UPI001E4ACA8F|nr:molybdopterin-dependent oxidoreductase [Salipaludibacillus sp. CUR1]MCE7792926.1 molybdopterin-dependent oxidoreductase [Salipaludibacillus sp. CUR1]
MKEKTQFVRNVCPRNCFSTCSMVTKVVNGRVIKVAGDPLHGFSKGKLCAKGYSYPEYVYSSKRLLNPLFQKKRGSGNWHEISWEEAYNIISDKIITLYDKHQTHLALAYNKFSGNLGLLHNAMEGFFHSLGAHTKAEGNPCLGTGRQSLRFQRGTEFSPRPENMAMADAIIIWGSNPAVTNIHQMKFIHTARDQGAPLVVIDPLFTETAKTADIYIQVRPGQDLWLAAAVLKLLLSRNSTGAFKIPGWKMLKKELIDCEMDFLLNKCGVSYEAVKELANIYEYSKNAAAWIGYGAQRHYGSSASVRMIDAISLITEDMFKCKRDVYYFHPELFRMPNRLVNDHITDAENCRNIDFRNFSNQLPTLQDPPVEFLWLFSRNPLSQDENVKEWMHLMKEMDLVVVSDLFLTKTAELADLVLPVTTHFEHWDLHVSYWNHWLSLNEPAIKPAGNVKSDLQIARELAMVINSKRPGMSSFRTELSDRDWLSEEVASLPKGRYPISSWEELRIRPAVLNDTSKLMKQADRVTFYSEKDASKTFFTEWNVSDKVTVNHTKGPFKVLSPQSLLHIHSQFEPRVSTQDFLKVTEVKISSSLAASLGLKKNDKVLLFNEHSEIERHVKIDSLIPENVLVLRQGGDHPVNELSGYKPDCSEGAGETSEFFDTRAYIVKLEEAGR